MVSLVLFFGGCFFYVFFLSSILHDFSLIMTMDFRASKNLYSSIDPKKIKLTSMVFHVMYPCTSCCSVNPTCMVELETQYFLSQHHTEMTTVTKLHPRYMNHILISYG